jgi:hypothetical protein
MREADAKQNVRLTHCISFLSIIQIAIRIREKD